MNHLRDSDATTAPVPWRQATRRAMLAALPRHRLLASLPPGTPHVALTFDDGPDPEVTPRILDALATACARATFFVIGERAEAHPALVARMADEGHTVGHHSWTHSDPATTGAATLLTETRRCRSLIEALTGIPAPLFRPPHGKMTVRKCLMLWRDGNTIVLWNRDPKDYQIAAPAILANWCRDHPMRPGDIVLLHDTSVHTATALSALLASLPTPGGPVVYR